MYTRAAASSTFTAATLSIVVTLLTLTCTSALTIRPNNPGLSKRVDVQLRIQCHGNLPALFSSTGIRNYPANYDHPDAIWNNLEHYCTGWGHSNVYFDAGGGGCTCILPGRPLNVALPVGAHPICRGGNQFIPGYNAAAFNAAPATEICRQVCTCVELPQVVPPDPNFRPPSPVVPMPPRVAPAGPAPAQVGPVDPNRPQVAPS